MRQQEQQAPDRSHLKPLGGHFIRWGEIGAVSKNHATGKAEAGLSCFPCRADDEMRMFMVDGDPAFISKVWRENKAAIKAVPTPKLLLLRSENLLESRGSDGEPLIEWAKWEEVGRLRYDPDSDTFSLDTGR